MARDYLDIDEAIKGRASQFSQIDRSHWPYLKMTAFIGNLRQYVNNKCDMSFFSLYPLVWYDSSIERDI